MSKIITVIQLLNRTANGEEIPKIVKCNGKKYNYHDYSKNYYYIEDTEECLFDDNIAFLANDEVEILEDNTEEIEELDRNLKFDDLITPYGKNEDMMWTEIIKQHNKIDEIIRYIKRKDKSND